jgi:hypothetical protein
MVALRTTHGHLVYALDDTYIHMAIAKNLAAHGVFGVTSHEFVSASSSILWPLLLAVLYKLCGPLVVIPLLAQIAIGIVLLGLSWEVLSRSGVTSNLYAGAVLSLLVVALPMVPMTFVAMEHLLHALATLLFAAVSVNYLYGSRAYGSRTSFGRVLLCAAAVVAVRYEGLFLVAAVGLLFLLKKKPVHAIAIAAAGATPVVLFGLVSISLGGFFLPNSLLLKGRPIGIGTLLRLRDIQTACPEVFVLGFAALLLLIFGTKLRRQSRGLLGVFIVAALLHHMLAAYGWFYRYEAYLVALGLISVASAAWEYMATAPAHRAWLAAALLLVLLAKPLILRGYNSITTTPEAMADIYHQQFQMAEFFGAYYPEGRIAMNDIGAISFYGDPYCTDLIGLGSTEITRARLSAHTANVYYALPNSKAVQAVIRENHVEVAAVYDELFGLGPGSLPPGWIKVGSWEVPGKTLLIRPVVSFYGVGEENAGRLRNHLAAFHSQLPQELSRQAIP